jgi:hypothetical protein
MDHIPVLELVTLHLLFGYSFTLLTETPLKAKVREFRPQFKVSIKGVEARLLNLMR